MTLGDVAQTIGACVLAFNAYQSWRNGRLARKALAGVDALAPVVEAVAKQTDGLTKQLVKVTGEQRFDEGVRHGEANARSDEEK
jgi:hypothetical protein